MIHISICLVPSGLEVVASLVVLLRMEHRVGRLVHRLPKTMIIRWREQLNIQIYKQLWCTSVPSPHRTNSQILTCVLSSKELIDHKVFTASLQVVKNDCIIFDKISNSNISRFSAWGQRCIRITSFSPTKGFTNGQFFTTLLSRYTESFCMTKQGSRSLLAGISQRAM